MLLAGNAPTFEQLIAPTSAQQFLEQYWERGSLFVEQADDSNFADVLTLSNVDEYLTRSDLRYPAVRLVHCGRQVPTSDYTTSFAFGGYSTKELIRSDRVLSLYWSGATILIQLAHLSLPSLRPLAANLERYWGFNVEMNVYLTPPSEQGFTAHYDNHSVCVLQISGEKTWSLYSQRDCQPLLQDRFDQDHDNPGPLQSEVVLKPGSFLYVPRGLYHSARANKEPSLHLTVGLFPPTWLDILHEHLISLSDLPAFRRAPTVFEKNDAELLCTRFAESFAFDACRERLSRRLYTSESQPADHRLLDLLASASLTEATCLRVRPSLNVLLSRSDGYITLRCFGALVQFPKVAGATLRQILAQTDRFTPLDIESDLDHDEILVLCRRLLREGVLTTAT